MARKESVELSKAGLRFVNRVDYFDEDIEFVELLYKQRSNLLKSETLLFAEMSDSEPMLSRKQVCTQSRTLVVAHLRSTVYTAFIKEIYEEVTEYLRTLLEEAALISQTKEEAFKLIGNTKLTLLAGELLQYHDIQDIHKRIADDIMRQLENEKSTIKLIEKICERLSIKVDQQTIDSALPYLELRHILVHSDGKPDSTFIEKYGDIFTIKKRSIVLNRDIAAKAKMKITDLIKAIDKEAVTIGIMKENTAK